MNMNMKKALKPTRSLLPLLLLVILASLSACRFAEGDRPVGTTASADLSTQGDESSGVPDETTKGEPDDGNEPYMQLIPDIGFEEGIKLLSQKDHSNGNRVTTLGAHSFYGTEVGSPLWSLAQWDSGPCLIANRVSTDNSEITDGRWRSFKYSAAENTMTFHLDTSLFYDGKPAKQGDYWPHLLIEQSSFGYSRMTQTQKQYYKCGAEKIILSLDIRLDGYQATPVDGDWVNAAQFLMYFYLRGTAAGSKDFCWFGVQLFDNRWQYNDHYIGYDGGKPDASGAMIFTIGSKYLYSDGSTLWKNNAPEPNGGWVHIEIDIKPYLEQMFEKGRNDGYFKTASLDGLYIDGMNLGWETIATFNNAISVKNLSLISYLGEE